MADLHQTIDLRAPLDARFAQRGAVYRRERLNLDIVFQNRDAGLDDLELVARVGFRKAKPVASDDHAVVERHPVADAAEFAHGHMGMGGEIVANLAALVENDVRMNDRPAPIRTCSPITA